MSAKIAETMSDRERWKAFAVMVGVVLVLAIDGTVLYLAVPSLSEDLEPSATQILWIGDIYSVALAGLLVTMGNLADRSGRKRLMVIGLMGFMAASLIAALSSSAEMLIAARLLLGVAASMIMPTTLSMVRNLFPDATERTKAIAIWSAATGGGIALGPLVGGMLLEHFWWGSVFLVNVPLIAALLVFAVRLLPESRDPDPGRFDPVSSGLSIATMVPLVYAIKHGVAEGFTITVIASLVVGLTAGTAFIQRQRHLPAPMIDVRLFRNRAFSGAVLADFIAIFALTGLLFFFSQYLQLGRGYSPLEAGLAELPTTLAAIAVIGLVGVALARLGRGRAIAAGLVLTAAGLALVGVATGDGPYLWLALALVPVGLGVGLAMTLTADAVMSAVPADKSGAASAIAETVYELGVALGIAILGSVIAGIYRTHLELPAGLSAHVRDTAKDSLASAMHVFEPGSPAAAQALHAFESAIRSTSFAAAAVTLLAAFAAWRSIPSSVDTTDVVDTTDTTPTRAH